MNKDMEYMIAKVGAKSADLALERVENEVNFMVNQGWTPQGGVQIATVGVNYIAIQAMVKKEEKQNGCG